MGTVLLSPFCVAHSYLLPVNNNTNNNDNQQTVFHQADASGRPVMDLGHVVTALNKLDAGDDEKIVLASRDGKSIMVVSYGDVARYLENAFSELCNSSASMQQPLRDKGWMR